MNNRTNRTTLSSSEEYDQSLTEIWINDMKKVQLKYREPVLDVYLSDKVRLFCDSFEQDSHVFHMAIDILEDFIMAQNLRGSKIKDPLLTVLSIVYLSGKQQGNLSDYKTGPFIKLYNKLCDTETDNSVFKKTELQIFKTLLKFTQIPLRTQVDDLKTLITRYVKPKELVENFTEVAVNMLDFYTLYKREIFLSLKLMYSQNEYLCNVFRKNVTSRFYTPCAIIVCTIDLSEILSKSTAKSLVKTLCKVGELHLDDVTHLANLIMCLLDKEKSQHEIKIKRTVIL